MDNVALRVFKWRFWVWDLDKNKFWYQLAVRVKRVRRERVPGILRRSDAPGDGVMGNILVPFESLESPLLNVIKYFVVGCHIANLWSKNRKIGLARD